MAAAFTVALCAQAASVNWSAGAIASSTDPDNYWGEGYVGRLFNTQIASVADITAQLGAGNFTGYWANGLSENSVPAGTETGEILAGSYATYTAGTYDWYAVILDAGSTSDAKKFYITQVKNAGIVDGEGMETTIKFGDQENSWVTSNWSSVGGSTPTPEPTSGLLMLIGMAGLALRRRRA